MTLHDAKIGPYEPAAHLLLCLLQFARRFQWGGWKEEEDKTNASDQIRSDQIRLDRGMSTRRSERREFVNIERELPNPFWIWVPYVPRNTSGFDGGLVGPVSPDMVAICHASPLRNRPKVIDNTKETEGLREGVGCCLRDAGGGWFRRALDETRRGGRG